VDNATSYFSTNGTLSSLSGAYSNFSILPTSQNVIFTNGSNTCVSSPSSALISGKAASNICYADSGKSFIYVEKISNLVYRAFTSAAEAISATESLHKQAHWQKWLAQQLGTKVYVPNVPLNTPHTWALKDADGCPASAFAVSITAPPTPLLVSGNIVAPTSSNNGTATVTYLGGGAPRYLYGSQRMSSVNDQISVSSLQYGDNLITFFDSSWNQSASIVITVPGKGIAEVRTTPQTCASPNGSLTIATQGLSGSAAYTAELVAAPYTKYSKAATGGSCTFDNLPAGIYKVSVAQSGSTYSKSDFYAVASRIFSITTLTATHAATLAGAGSLSVTLANAASGAKCYVNSVEYPIASGAVSVSGLPAGQYAVRAEGGGCAVHDTAVVAAPACWGALSIAYAGGLCRISAGEVYGNSLFSGYAFRVKNAAGEVLAQGYPLNASLPASALEGGGGEVEAYHPATGDRATLCALPQVSGIAYTLALAQPACPYDSGVVAVAPLAGAFAASAAGVEVSYDGGFSYGTQWRRSVAPSPLGSTEVPAVLRDRKAEACGSVAVAYTYEQPIDTLFVAPEEVFALPRYAHVSCAGLGNGQIWLENLRGGSGAFRYRLNGGAWRAGGDTVRQLQPGAYAVQLQDSKGLCSLVALDSVTLREPAPLAVDTMLIRQPTCEQANGSVGFRISGGSGYYRAAWRYNGLPCRGDALPDSLAYRSEAYRTLGDTLRPGLYTLTVTDAAGCTASGSATLREYRNPTVASASAAGVRCHGEANGSVALSLAQGTAGITLVNLYSPDSSYLQGSAAGSFAGLRAGSYLAVAYDTLGCRSSAPYPLTITEPDSLRAALQVAHTTCGDGNGAMSARAYGGAAPYAYLWSTFFNIPLGSDTLVAGLQASGSAEPYRLTVTDRHSCRRQVLQDIHPSAPPSIAGLQASDALCHGDSTGTARLTALAPASPYAPYRIQWSNGDTGLLASRLSKGMHHVAVEDANGCADVRRFSIGQPAPVEVAVGGIGQPAYLGDSSGYIAAEGSGGAGRYRYLWSTGDTTPGLAQLAQGSYRLLLSDANGCTARRDFTLAPPDALPLTVDSAAVGATGVAGADGEAPPTVYPNPTTGKVQVAGVDGEQEVSVYSAAGAFLLRTSHRHLNLAPYPSGVYLLKVGKKVLKVVRQ
jgi:hypothetical protein